MLNKKGEWILLNYLQAENRINTDNLGCSWKVIVSIQFPRNFLFDMKSD